MYTVSCFGTNLAEPHNSPDWRSLFPVLTTKDLVGWGARQHLIPIDGTVPMAYYFVSLPITGRRDEQIIRRDGLGNDGSKGVHGGETQGIQGHAAGDCRCTPASASGCASARNASPIVLGCPWMPFVIGGSGRRQPGSCRTSASYSHHRRPQICDAHTGEECVISVGRRSRPPALVVPEAQKRDRLRSIKACDLQQRKAGLMLASHSIRDRPPRSTKLVPSYPPLGSSWAAYH